MIHTRAVMEGKIKQTTGREREGRDEEHENMGMRMSGNEASTV